jgi:hypothetical protein
MTLTNVPSLKSKEEALRFVRSYGIVLESGKGLVPNLADAVAGETVRGNWWSHPKGRQIFALTRFIRESANVLVCRLVENKVTYVHRRLWPALVRLSAELGLRKLDAIREEHTVSGAHKVKIVRFPKWVPPEVRAAASRLSRKRACALLKSVVVGECTSTSGYKT